MRIVVIFVDVRSVHNVGSMFRTADAAGVEKIYLCGITPTPLDRFGKMRSDFLKVALGADVSWEYAKSALRTIAKLKKEGWKIVAVEQAKNSVLYTKIAKKTGDRMCLVMGNEVTGLKSPLLKRADVIAEIPMRGKKESLNVGVAFGVAIFSIRFGSDM
jgi:tRNA G18 (ribose-2'-O)-methylase SpoU